MVDDDKTVPQEGQTDKKVPPSPEGGQTQDKGAPEKPVVPDALKGKSSDDLVKMYGELERKLGEQGGELGQARKFQQDMAVVLEAIYAVPEAKEKIESYLDKKLGGKAEDKDKKTTPQTSDDTRAVLESRIIKEFEEEHGLDSISQEKRKDIYKKIGTELAEMLDPGGKKTYQEILASISLQKLPAMLGRAYRLADTDGAIRQEAEKARIQVAQDYFGAIGSIPSSGGVRSGATLTPEERNVARKLGISDEDYLKNRQELSNLPA